MLSNSIRLIRLNCISFLRLSLWSCPSPSSSPSLSPLPPALALPLALPLALSFALCYPSPALRVHLEIIRRYMHRRFLTVGY